MLTKIQYLRKKPSVGMGADPNSGYGGAYGANSVVTTDEFGNIIPGGGGGSSIDANGNVTDEFGNIIPGGGTVIPDNYQEDCAYSKTHLQALDQIGYSYPCLFLRMLFLMEAPSDRVYPKPLHPSHLR